MTGWAAALERFLRTDSADVGCEQTLRNLDRYVELVLDDTFVDPLTEAGRRYPGVAVHLRACGPCRSDHDGVLAAVLDESAPIRGARR